MMDTNTEFGLSRIHAEGWNAARKHLSDPGDAKIATLNPYKAAPERERWTAGFTSALNRQ
jgi:hypothetical protein